ncbi:MAG: hypothetical protein ACOH1V_13445 [Stenotrophomonas sp.]
MIAAGKTVGFFAQVKQPMELIWLGIGLRTGRFVVAEYDRESSAKVETWAEVDFRQYLSVQ